MEQIRKSDSSICIYYETKETAEEVARNLALRNGGEYSIAGEYDSWSVFKVVDFSERFESREAAEKAFHNNYNGVQERKSRLEISENEDGTFSLQVHEILYAYEERGLYDVGEPGDYVSSILKRGLTAQKVGDILSEQEEIPKVLAPLVARTKDYERSDFKCHLLKAYGEMFLGRKERNSTTYALAGIAMFVTQFNPTFNFLYVLESGVWSEITPYMVVILFTVIMTWIIPAILFTLDLFSKKNQKYGVNQKAYWDLVNAMKTLESKRYAGGDFSSLEDSILSTVDRLEQAELSALGLDVSTHLAQAHSEMVDLGAEERALADELEAEARYAEALRGLEVSDPLAESIEEALASVELAGEEA